MRRDRGLSRRRFLADAARVAGAASFGAALGPLRGLADVLQPRKSRVILARDERLAKHDPAEQAELIRRMLDAAIQKLTGRDDPAEAWRAILGPARRVGIKVNCLGLTTHPAVAAAIAAGAGKAGVPAERILIWDRFDVELRDAGYKLSRSGSGVRCYGTDAEGYGRGYERKIEQSGEVGTCFSRIVAEQVDTLITAAVLKDHNLAGISGGMKNFFGAIHNPNKYHDDNCDPFIVDVVQHRYIRPKLRLSVIDGTRAQYHGGPARRREYSWAFGGLIVSTDVVAADAVAADLIDAERLKRGLKKLAEDGRPTRHIETAAKRRLGVADLGLIERIEL